jgi:hypothetical protein
MTIPVSKTLFFEDSNVKEEFCYSTCPTQLLFLLFLAGASGISHVLLGCECKDTSHLADTGHRAWQRPADNSSRRILRRSGLIH